jgi:type IV pilus assembly protein PilO
MSPAIRQSVFFLVLLALPISSYFLVFKPQNVVIEKARKEIEMKESKLTKLREYTARASDLQRENDQIKAAIETIQSRLPSGKEMDNVLRQVSSIAAKAGLTVPNFKKSDKTQAAGLAFEQPTDIEMVGDFDGYYKFLLELEKLPRITRIPDLEIKRDDKVNGEMKTKFVLSVYYEGDTGPEGIK